MQEVNGTRSLGIFMATTATIAWLGLGCQTFTRSQPSHAKDQNSLCQMYDQLRKEPSENRMLDVLLFCSEKHVTEDDLVMLRNRLREPDQIIGTVNDVNITQHEFAIACLRSVIGSSLNIDGLPVKTILSRSIADTPYRYHLYVVGPGNLGLLEERVSIWISGFMSGRESEANGGGH